MLAHIVANIADPMRDASNLIPKIYAARNNMFTSISILLGGKQAILVYFMRIQIRMDTRNNSQ